MTDPELSYAMTPGRLQGTLILKLTGPLTINTMFGFQEEFRAMRPPVLIVDLSDSPYMDSAGLGLLLNQYVSAQSGQRTFMISGVSGRIMALIQLTKVDQVLSIFPSVERAEDSLLKLHPRPATEARPAQ
jgi:anti-sigma B factor antagonist